MRRHDREASSGASPDAGARLRGAGARIATATFLAVAGAMVAWDAAQLFGVHGQQHRQALAALALHPLKSMAEHQAETRRLAAERALWVREGRVQPPAQLLLQALARAGEDGLDPEGFRLAELRRLTEAADHGDASALKQLPDRLSGALVSHVRALKTPAVGVRVVFADPSVAPAPPSAGAVLDAAVRAPSFAAFLDQARAVNGLAGGLRQALAACRANRAACSPSDRALLLANYERARALPADLGGRYILVNVPEQRLWMVDHGRIVDQMPVVVGKLSEPTPELAAVVRAALFKPYWNVPPDLTRDNIAPAVLREGPDYLARQHLEVMSDWTPGAHVIDPAEVDWAAVAAGQVSLRLRQTPGPQNMMGAVKFELPNRLGIYLHDTPHRQLFDRAVRAESSGCVRLQDARRLAVWLLGSAEAPSSQPEARVAVRPPTPVYITYLTARVEDGRVVRADDLYGRDKALIAALAPIQEAAAGQAQ